jgi:hypothetical protein
MSRSPVLSCVIGSTKPDFRHGLAARSAPISDRLHKETRFGEMVSQCLGPPLHRVAKPLLERAGDLSVQ